MGQAFGYGAEVLGGLEVVLRLSGGQQTLRDPATAPAAHGQHPGFFQGQALLLSHGHVSRVLPNRDRGGG